MPHLQTLRLWRSDDFPWSLRKFCFEIRKLITVKFAIYVWQFYRGEGKVSLNSDITR